MYKSEKFDDKMVSWLKGFKPHEILVVTVNDTAIRKNMRPSEADKTKKVAQIKNNLLTELKKFGWSDQKVEYRQPVCFIGSRGGVGAIDMRSVASDQEIIRARVKVTVHEDKKGVKLEKVQELRQSFYAEEFAHLHNRMGPTKEVKLQKRREEVVKNKLSENKKPCGKYDMAIPSYKRVEQLTERALPFLKKQGIPAEKIFIFVADDEECKDYLNALNGDENEFGGKWQQVKKWIPDKERKKGVGHVVVGKRGIRKQRNRIVLFFPQGRHVVSCDDDVELLHCKVNETDCIPLADNSLDKVIRDAEANMILYGSYLWGLNPSANNLNMKKQSIMTGNGVVSADFHGMFVRHDKSLKRVVADVIEDEEMSLRWFRRDGIVEEMMANKIFGYLARCEFWLKIGW